MSLKTLDCFQIQYRRKAKKHTHTEKETPKANNNNKTTAECFSTQLPASAVCFYVRF